MDNIILQLYASFIVAIIGFVLPLLAILFSFLPQGINSLTEKYKGEIERVENKIKSEQKKWKKKGFDIRSFEKFLKELKKIKKETEEKLNYLKPVNILIKLFLSFTGSFLLILLSIFYSNVDFKIAEVDFFNILIFLSLFLLFIGGKILFKSFCTINEIAEVSNQERNAYENKVIELLTVLIKENSKDKMLIGESEINIYFNKEKIIENKIYEFSVSKKVIEVSIENNSERMAKKAEFGIIFSTDFLIEKTSNIKSITTDGDKQIIRFENDFIHSQTKSIQGGISINFLKAGDYDVKAFLKGENIKTSYINFKIKVIE
ncbi:hypothetical protein M0R01_00945 [bacterium]|nr:hypothetical protein [bacterium]